MSSLRRIVSISLLLTARGFQNLYCLVFLCMETREVIVSSPNSAWVKGQTEAFIEQTEDRTEKPAVVMHDRDTKFTKEFVAVLEGKATTDHSTNRGPQRLVVSAFSQSTGKLAR